MMKDFFMVNNECGDGEVHRKTLNIKLFYV